jgi:hypothetical protein
MGYRICAYFCTVMKRKLFSIAFAVQIIWFSIGVQVMEHHCVWCGGDRIEVMGHTTAEADSHDCCGEKETDHHGCEHDGCCQPELVKLTTGINLEDGSELSVDVRTVTYDFLFVTINRMSDPLPGNNNEYRDLRGSPFPLRPAAFRVPMRC